MILHRSILGPAQALFRLHFASFGQGDYYVSKTFAQSEEGTVAYREKIQ